MATQRRQSQKVSIDVPISNGDIKKAADKLDSPSGSPFLPTSLEAALLAIYPATLLLGSLFSTLHPASRNATYLPNAQSYDPQNAPSYFAKKSNVFNVWFVKIGWFWITLAFTLLIFSHSSLGPPLRPQLTRRRIQAILRYTCVTAIWIFVTQWFFGPAIIDRSFRWTGGKCNQVLSDSLDEKMERGDVKEVFSHAACKAVNGQWIGGHDISGHVFLLILGSAMLWLELLPAVLRTEGLREKRRIMTPDGLTRSASFEVDSRSTHTNARDELGFGIKAALGVAFLSWWMLLMTAAYFHTWFEKVTGLLVAFLSIYTVYFLPRGVPVLRQWLGMPVQ
ncbi:FIT family protein scs3 [Pseudocercospora fuligena]|uniref:Acyl-coenzyme A diphosphatase SCS3 n=1 Tax=Pseudocercospora fuligena TaxID=685502 RepID=A0A8H6VMG2_9PEZI|nr:FIT family protein scs3 [Pseudocercospora fuligena]